MAIKLITKYQRHISPFLKEQGYKCLFEPTCSKYALGCFEKHSFFKASALTVFRVFSCNPINAYIKRGGKVFYGERI